LSFIANCLLTASDPNDPHTTYCPDPPDGNWIPLTSPAGHAARRQDAWQDGEGNDNAYNLARRNPYFWGWQPFYSVVDSSSQQGHKSYARGSRLNVTEFDIQNEVDLRNVTVEGRLLVDNKQTPFEFVLTVWGWYMNQYGFSMMPSRCRFGREEPSHPETPPYDHVAFDCLSAYGDSARSSAPRPCSGDKRWFPFGHTAPADVSYGLDCGGTLPGSICPVGTTPAPCWTFTHKAASKAYPAPTRTVRI